ncbi:hypothetical protein L227DRAFT_582204 [Lentinus tigrinus ALCF2SS1-6]|uniref:Uncharacterized protein n=1 Tax=Lentinus tigrinus ALCF2SS1-6 TaxID=1328759 RepID=A0A5C2RKA7_9APHY|nr:hypothetical protein L227DRAFT_582204 [Lentinus tigrinus ALCF2SS1-6]
MCSTSECGTLRVHSSGTFKPKSNLGPFLPTNSPPASLASATKGRLSISGLPSQEADTFSTSSSPSGLPNNKPVNGNSNSMTSPVSLPAPNPPAWRPSSVSPTLRKRYTVALGMQIIDRGSRPRSQ